MGRTRGDDGEPQMMTIDFIGELLVTFFVLVAIAAAALAVSQIRRRK